MAKEKPKAILRDVAFPDRTFKPGDEDDLEKRLTKERYEAMMKEEPPPLEGHWSPAGKGDKPMKGSRGDPTREKSHDDLRKENEQLQAKVDALEKAQAANKPAVVHHGPATKDK